MRDAGETYYYLLKATSTHVGQAISAQPDLPDFLLRSHTPKSWSFLHEVEIVPESHLKHYHLEELLENHNTLEAVGRLHHKQLMLDNLP